jgi:hypothetical protein
VAMNFRTFLVEYYKNVGGILVVAGSADAIWKRRLPTMDDIVFTGFLAGLSPFVIPAFAVGLVYSCFKPIKPFEYTIRFGGSGEKDENKKKD